MLTMTAESGQRHHFHTDPTEANCFAKTAGQLSAGVHELAILLGHTPNADDLTHEELVLSWMAKVTGAGMSKAHAEEFLQERLGNS